MKKMRKIWPILALVLLLASCQTQQKVPNSDNPENNNSGNNYNLSQTLTYGSSSRITRINPLLDEHGELNPLLFNGLTAHGKNGEIIPSLAKNWEYDQENETYKFYLEEGVKWHDGAPFTAEDVKFTIEAIKNPENQSENAPNYEEVEEIVVENDHTVVFKLSAPNAAFLDYMCISILPKHALEEENINFSEFFTKNPIGTGPYKIAAWEDGQYIDLVRNDEYFQDPPKIPRIIVKFLPDDSSRFLQLKTGEIDLAQLPPINAETLENIPDFAVYHMKTSDYRGIMFNFNDPYWQRNRDLIPPICYALDREKMVNSILLGRGEPAYGPLQRNVYNNDQIQRYTYDLDRAKFLIESIGFQKKEDGYYYRNGEKAAFTISVPPGDEIRLSLAQAARQDLEIFGIEIAIKIANLENQPAHLIGWGSPFDADDHTYKVFASGKSANYAHYSNPLVDKALTAARSTGDPELRREAYNQFQEALAADPAFAFLCYVDADYAAVSALNGISEDVVLGHHGVGIFWNIAEWTLER